MIAWITNVPEMAALLRQIDEHYEAAREAARGLPLAEKVVAYREARLARQTAWEALR
jgi:hypothetical protein